MNKIRLTQSYRSSVAVQLRPSNHNDSLTGNGHWICMETKTFNKCQVKRLFDVIPAESFYPFPIVKTVNTKKTPLDF